MTRRRSLTDEEADELYSEYCAWRDALRRLHPARLAEKYRVSHDTVLKYVRERQRRAA